MTVVIAGACLYACSGLLRRLLGPSVRVIREHMRAR